MMALIHRCTKSSHFYSAPVFCLVGENGKNGFPSLVQETLQSDGKSSSISFQRFLFCAPSTSVLLHSKGAGHGVSWLSYVQHGRTQN